MRYQDLTSGLRCRNEGPGCVLQRRHRLPSAAARSSASSLCTLGCSSALARPHVRSTFLGTNRREGVTSSGLHGAQKGLRVGAARRRKRRKKKGMGVGCVGGRWQRLSQMLQVSARGGAYRFSSSAIHTPSADPYSPIAPPKSRLTWVLLTHLPAVFDRLFHFSGGPLNPVQHFAAVFPFEKFSFAELRSIVGLDAHTQATERGT